MKDVSITVDTIGRCNDQRVLGDGFVNFRKTTRRYAFDCGFDARGLAFVDVISSDL